MDADEMRRKIAHLEFINDQLSAELAYVDRLLQLVGFPAGLETVKDAAHEILQEQRRRSTSTESDE